MKKMPFFPILFALLWTNFSQAQPGNPDPGFGGGDGYLTTTFLAGGHVNGEAVAIQPNGRIVVVGDTWIPQQAGSSQIALSRFMPNGDPDPTFSGDGKTLLAVNNMEAGAYDVAVQADGKILVVGNVWTDTTAALLIARFNIDGTPDNSFDGDGVVITKVGIADEYLTGMAIQPDGKIVVAGTVNRTGYYEFAVLRFTSNGTLDYAFGGGDGIVTTPVGSTNSGASAVLLQPDGKITAVGYGVSAYGDNDFAAVRYTANGVADNTFSGDGIATIALTNQGDRAYDAALQTDGKIVLAGYAGETGTIADLEFAVVRLNADGTPDNSFGGDGIAIPHVSDYADRALAVLVQPDGKILLGGSSRANLSDYHFGLVRLLANGLPDPGFSDDGKAMLVISPVNDEINALALQPDGKVVAVGWSRFDYLNVMTVARFLTGLTVATDSPQVFSNNISLYPNPIREQATLEYEVVTAQKIAINLYDAHGRLIQNLLPSTDKTTGKHTEILVFKAPPPGNYLLVIESPAGNKVIKAIFQE